ncbi:hypothetical protein SDC9_125988 [bioreactor metagenome]|uniref:Uncharacterized protein n=1 Tax=bioreactor metagenome TaxID=1076179 RepID=A0A645CPX1_9ZZZZ
MVVETLVNRCNINFDIGMITINQLDAFRSSYKAHQFNMFSAFPFQQSNSCGSRTAGSQHRVDNNKIAFLDIGRQFAVVLNRF